MTKPFTDVSTLLSLIHTGAWCMVPAAAAAVASDAVPTDLQELTEYRRRLRETLMVARAARAHLATELGQLQASSLYQNGTDVPERSATRVSGGHTV